MLKKDIKFTWEDDDETPPKQITETRTYRFNLNEVEMMRLEAQYQADGGYLGMLTAISNGRKSNAEIMGFFEELVSRSYGVKEGPDFLKSEELRNRFMCSPAYNALIMEFLEGNSAVFLADFIINVLPKSLMTPEAQKAMTEAAAAESKPTIDTAPPKG